MKLLAVVVNYKTPQMTLEALTELVQALGTIPGSRGIVVDNDSADGSFEHRVHVFRASSQIAAMW